MPNQPPRPGDFVGSTTTAPRVPFYFLTYTESGKKVYVSTDPSYRYSKTRAKRDKIVRETVLLVDVADTRLPRLTVVS